METIKINILNQNALTILEGMEQAGLILLPKKEVSNKNAKNILIKDFEHEDEVRLKRVFDEYNNSNEKIIEFLNFLDEKKLIFEAVAEEEFKVIYPKLESIQKKLDNVRLNEFNTWKETKLLNIDNLFIYF